MILKNKEVGVYSLFLINNAEGSLDLAAENLHKSEGHVWLCNLDQNETTNLLMLKHLSHIAQIETKNIMKFK